MPGPSGDSSLELKAARWLFIGITMAIASCVVVGFYIGSAWQRLIVLEAGFSVSATMLFGLLGLRVPGIMREVIKTLGQVFQGHKPRL